MLNKQIILSLLMTAALLPPVTAAYASGLVADAPRGTSFTLVGAAAPKATSERAQKAHDFIKKLAARGIGMLSEKGMTPQKRKQEFRKLLHDSFDMKTIARFSLGRYWKTCNEAQRKEYLKLFENMIVDVYTRRFGEYDGQKLNVLTARDEGEADAVVASEIVPKSGPSIKIDWRVRQKDGKAQVVDIIVEGVSMSITQRADFASVIERGGGNIESLLTHLRAP